MAIEQDRIYIGSKLADLTEEYSKKLNKTCDYIEKHDEHVSTELGFLLFFIIVFIISIVIVFSENTIDIKYIAGGFAFLAILGFFFLLFKEDPFDSGQYQIELTNVRQFKYSLQKIIKRASALIENESTTIDEFDSFLVGIKLGEAELALHRADKIVDKLDGKEELKTNNDSS